MADTSPMHKRPDSKKDWPEFTLKAVLVGLVLAVVLGAANAYLGLKAGMTIAATYPAAVIGMAVIKLLKGNILEENMARTIGSIGESVAAGAIFTLPAFFIAGIWNPFFTPGNYITSTLILIAGGVLGIMFVALLRKVMVEDKELPYPESVAAAEIHKAGQKSKGSSKHLFLAMGLGALIKLLGELRFFATYWEKFVLFGKKAIAGSGFTGEGGMLVGSPGISPAYMGVGYIIGPKLASLNFSGGVLAWGLLVPMILYFMGPSLNIEAMQAAMMAADPSLGAAEAAEKAWTQQSYSVWKFVVRPIAIGGMLVSAALTLFKMRKSLTEGIRRSVNDVKKATAGSESAVERTEKDLPFTWVMAGVFGTGLLTFFIAWYIFGTSWYSALTAALLLTLLAFFFAAVSGYLVGIMGSSNNPISGLTLTALVVTALIMVGLGARGIEGVATVLGVAAIVCVSAAVAGEMLQDLKAGHLLGGTPWRMQVGDLIGVVIASTVMFGVLVYLNEGDIAKGLKEGYQGGFGSKELSAPQASLMSIMSKGIVEGAMAWPLIIGGMLMGAALILMQVKSPMLICVGMYLPLETTFAIFLGGLVKGLADMAAGKRNFGEEAKLQMENAGILLSSGLIAGEALMGLVIAIFAAGNIFLYDLFTFFKVPPVTLSLLMLAIIAWLLIALPLRTGSKRAKPVTRSAEV
ncbi:MAG: OPT family oligopeptide transporter [Bacteroidales bacterium]